MARDTGTYVITTTLSESVRAFVPHPLTPTEPALASGVYAELNRQAELALARLAGVSGLVPSVDWLLYSAIRKEALLTSQIEGTQATLTDLFDKEAGFKVSNTDDVDEVTNYLRAFAWSKVNYAIIKDYPSAYDCCATPTDCYLMGSEVHANSLESYVARKTGLAARGLARPLSCQQLDTTFPTATAAVKMLEDLGIVTEMTGQKKNRSYSYQNYVELLSR